jgi:hypothetical protein
MLLELASAEFAGNASLVKKNLQTQWVPEIGGWSVSVLDSIDNSFFVFSEESKVPVSPEAYEIKKLPCGAVYYCE